jgi:RNA polymerase sigma-70 factor (ECF subfamily)
MKIAPRPQAPPDDERSDLLLLDRVRTGDPQAFEALFRNWAERLCAFAHSYVDQHTAEDVVQDLFRWMWEHRHTLEVPRSLRAWLYSAVRNRSLNALRHERITLAFHERLARDSKAHAGAESAATAEAELAADDLAGAIAQVVRAMPPRSREVFTLLRDQHLSYAEVAELLHLSPKTVENHMTRALAFLRARLGPRLHY